MCAQEPGQKVCQDCNGYGKIGLTTMDCPTCRGRGIMTRMTMDEGGCYNDPESAE
jgi:hypothetical protein